MFFQSNTNNIKFDDQITKTTYNIDYICPVEIQNGVLTPTIVSSKDPIIFNPSEAIFVNLDIATPFNDIQSSNSPSSIQECGGFLSTAESNVIPIEKESHDDLQTLHKFGDKNGSPDVLTFPHEGIKSSHFFAEDKREEAIRVIAEQLSSSEPGNNNSPINISNAEQFNKSVRKHDIVDILSLKNQITDTNFSNNQSVYVPIDDVEMTNHQMSDGIIQQAIGESSSPSCNQTTSIQGRRNSDSPNYETKKCSLRGQLSLPNLDCQMTDLGVQDDHFSPGLETTSSCFGSPTTSSCFSPTSGSFYSEDSPIASPTDDNSFLPTILPSFSPTSSPEMSYENLPESLSQIELITKGDYYSMHIHYYP